MTWVLVLTFGAGFLVVFAVNLMLADLFTVRRDEIRRRLEADLRVEQRVRARDSLQHKELYELAAAGAVDLQSRMTLQERLELFVDQSGSHINPERVIVLMLIGSAVAQLLVGWSLGWTSGLMAAPVGGLIPFVYLHLLRARRTRKLQAQLPDVFDLVSRVLRAGRTIPQAFQSVADEFPRPASEEFGYAYEQQNLGLSPEAAMRELARRTGLLELKIFVMAVTIHQQTGGNLADLLDKLADVIRDRFRIKGMIRSLTAEGQLQAVILLGLPPLLLAAISVINRPYAMTLFEYPMLLTGMFGFMLLGAAWMHRIINFDFQSLAVTMDQQLIIYTALALGSLAIIILLVATGREDRVVERLSNLEGEGSAGQVRARAIPRLGASQTMRDAEQGDSRHRLRERIVQAGLYKPYAMGLFLAMRLALCVTPIVLGIMASSAGMITRNQGLLYGGLAGLIGTVAPTLWLDHLKRSRQRQIRRALPDALDIIVVCLEAGLSISGGLARVARELGTAHRLLALELGIVEREIQMGRSTGDAMRQLAQRFDMEELRSLAAVIIQAEQFGTSVVKAFTVYADSIRERRHQRAEELARKAAIKILFPTVLCIFPGIFIVLLGPAAIRLYQALIMGSRHGTL